MCASGRVPGTAPLAPRTELDNFCFEEGPQVLKERVVGIECVVPLATMSRSRFIGMRVGRSFSTSLNEVVSLIGLVIRVLLGDDRNQPVWIPFHG